MPYVLFIQDGARLHYAIPVALKRAGLRGALHPGYYTNNMPSARAIEPVWPGMVCPIFARRSQLRVSILIAIENSGSNRNGRVDFCNLRTSPAWGLIGRRASMRGLSVPHARSYTILEYGADGR